MGERDDWREQCQNATTREEKRQWEVASLRTRLSQQEFEACGALAEKGAVECLRASFGIEATADVHIEVKDSSECSRIFHAHSLPLKQSGYFRSLFENRSLPFREQ